MINKPPVNKKLNNYLVGRRIVILYMNWRPPPVINKPPKINKPPENNKLNNWMPGRRIAIPSNTLTPSGDN